MTSPTAAIERARLDGDLTKALELIKGVEKEGKATPAVRHQHALTLMAAHRYTEALDALFLLLSEKPHEAQVWINVGQCLESLGDWEASLKAYDCALKTPQGEHYAKAHFGRGNNLFRLGMNQWGREAWEKSISIPPQPNENLFQRSQVLLAFGRYEEGWKAYEDRRKNPGWILGVRGHGIDTASLAPEWDGRSSQRVVGYAEQGAGDVIMFSRYLPVVGFKTRFPAQASAGAELEPFLGSTLSVKPHVSVPLCSLPLRLGQYDPIPPTWKDWAKPSNPKPRLGVCWKGSKEHGYDKDRSCPFDFRGSLQDERWDLVSLQYGVDFKPKDYLETAELMRTLDAVVTVDTSVVHLAGTLGVPTILIPPAAPEWRWGFADSTPWYPSVRIIRRKEVSAWPEALRRAKGALSEKAF